MTRRDPSRPRAQRDRGARPRILVVCGSEKTEEAYLRGLRDRLANRAVDVALINRPKDPLSVVEYAAKYPEVSRQDFDEVWCVFDVDDFDTAPAETLAARRSINVASSNPCFEFWLLLHHEDHRAHLRTCSDALTRLRRLLASYDKTRPNIADFADGVAQACERAKRIDANADTRHPNPSSGVWRLVEKIMGGDDGSGER